MLAVFGVLERLFAAGDVAMRFRAVRESCRAWRAA
jgi:hypothetical protein